MQPPTCSFAKGWIGENIEDTRSPGGGQEPMVRVTSPDLPRGACGLPAGGVSTPTPEAGVGIVEMRVSFLAEKQEYIEAWNEEKEKHGVIRHLLTIL